MVKMERKIVMKNGHMVYKTSNVCSQEIRFDVVDGIVHNVKFIGGCRGNTQGVAALAEGMPIEEIPKRLRHIDCRGGSSCPDEFAKAAEKYIAENC